MTRVLIVDDQEASLAYLEALLGAHGMQATRARHGAEALASARQEPPDLVVSDLLMPVMDGYTLLRRWKSDPRLRAVPFVVYTATYTGSEDEKLALDLGADAFVLKPADPTALLERVRAALTLEPRQPRTEGAPPEGDDPALLRDYNQALVRRLEDKALQLEASNQRLRDDLAARAAAEAALRESEARFRELAESIDDAYWLCDLGEQRVLYASPAFERIWGRPAQFLLDTPWGWLHAVHAEDRLALERALERYGREPWEESYRVLRPDGAVRWVRTRAFPVRDAEGRPYRVATVSRDVTEYRRLEQQLRQAQKMEAVGRLAGGVAHDFNNLLSVVLSYTNFALEEASLSAGVRADLEEVQRAGERAADLTRQLLAFSRQQLVQPRVFDLRTTVSGMEKLMRRTLGEDVTLTLQLAQQPCRVTADPGQLEQVVLNLAVNARDAMPRGGRLTIQVAPTQVTPEEPIAGPQFPAGDYVLLTVTDTGIGMDAATRERIFEPFFTTKEPGKGTGLGLPTVYGIVKQSGGHIHVYSEPGLGTAFKIYLPRTELPADATPAPVSEPATLRGSETILLVEDDAQVREMMRTLLRRNGYEVLYAQSGEEALLLHERFDGRIDLLLTDVVMPRMNGREVAERLRAARPEIRVLFISGYSEAAVIDLGLTSPEVSFLAKPITPSALLRRLRELLDAGRAPAAPASG